MRKPSSELWLIYLKKHKIDPTINNNDKIGENVKPKIVYRITNVKWRVEGLESSKKESCADCRNSIFETLNSAGSNYFPTPRWGCRTPLDFAKNSRMTAVRKPKSGLTLSSIVFPSLLRSECCAVYCPQSENSCCL